MYRLILGFVLALLTACRPAAQQEPKRLRIPFSASPTTVDPRRSGDFTSSTLICLVFEGLTRCKGGAEVELALAQRVEISPDQKTYLFHLRHSTWSDGHPVTARDFEVSWKQILQPGFPSLCAYLLYPILNAEAYAKGMCAENAVGIHALDDLTLEVVLERPTPSFLSLTAFPMLLPFPTHNESASNGPFSIEEWRPNEKIVLRKNPLFWNASKTALPGIEIAIVPNETTALQMFERGELDCAGGPLSPLPLDALGSLKNLRFIPMAASTFCTFNLESGPFKNKSLRRAFLLAVDRSQVVIAEMGHAPAQRIIPPSLLDPNAKPLLPGQNCEAARQFFDQAMEELGTWEPPTLYYKGGQAEKRIAQSLQRQWKEVLGVEIEIEQLEPKTHLQKLHDKKYQIALASWIAQSHDPLSILERFKCRSHPKNYPGWENSEYARLLDAAQLSAAEELLAKEAALIPLYHWSSPLLLSPEIAGYQATCGGAILFERMEIK